MALVLILKSVEDLHGKADRFAKATFRGRSHKKNIYGQLVITCDLLMYIHKRFGSGLL